MKRQLEHGKIGQYLDIYYKGRRSYETLDLHLTSNRKHNNDILGLAKKICMKRKLEIQSGEYGFPIEKKKC